MWKGSSGSAFGSERSSSSSGSGVLCGSGARRGSGAGSGRGATSLFPTTSGNLPL